MTSCSVPSFKIFETTLHGIPVQNKLRLKHVVNPASQLWIASLSEMQRGVQLDLKSLDGYETDLGLLLVRVCQLVPKGVLAFFPDTAALASCLNKWKSIGLLARLNAEKLVAVEVPPSDAVGRPGRDEERAEEVLGQLQHERSDLPSDFERPHRRDD
jgi:hypothetical protein